MNLRMVCEMFVWCSSLCECMYVTVSYALIMSSATAIGPSGDLFSVNASCDGIVYAVQCCVCRMAEFEAVLCGDVLDIVCDLW